MTSSNRKKFLSIEVLDEAAREIASLAKAEDVDVALIGGYALQLYGSDRLTGDIDIVASEELASLPGKKRLTFGGVQSTTPLGGVPVDVVLREDAFIDLYDRALEAARRMRGVPIRVVTPEYLAAMKLVAQRTRDKADLEWLIASRTIDVHKARGLIRDLLGAYAAQDFDRVCDEVQWKWKVSKGRL